ncbi:MAG TPA: PP2C family protein-serine/threonine phosphatase [Thermoanaerobaculia bacterium]|nr:PP2C family protein-serine/threonine phosphatase [Thermoanaerobaculia bacterium]
MTSRLVAFLRRQPKGLLVLAGLAAIGLLAVLDYDAPLELSFLVFYVGPILFLLWFVGRWAGLLGVLVSAAYWFWEDVLSPHAYPDQVSADWNIAVRLVFMVLFVQAVAALKDALERERAAAQERLEHDVRIAQEVQARLFPQKAPDVSGIECAGVCRPARSVAGDYYDFVALDARHLGVAVGDVSGKGLPAALLMASVQGALRSFASMANGGPARLASDLNAQVHALTERNRFVTFFWAVLDGETGGLAWVNAGHNPPFLVRASGRVERLASSGPPLGILPAPVYREERTVLGSGDLLVVYTDGVTEAEDVAEIEYGDARLEMVVSEAARRGEPPPDVCRRVLEAVAAFESGVEQYDDITVVAAKTTR